MPFEKTYEGEAKVTTPPCVYLRNKAMYVRGTVGDAGLRCTGGDGTGPVAILTELGRRELRCVTADGLVLLRSVRWRQHHLVKFDGNSCR